MRKERLAAMQVALGQKPADLVIQNGQIIDVYTRQIYPGGIAMKGNRIAAVGEVDDCIGSETETIDAGGQYLSPGFIDSHIHVGASQLGMTELARLLVSKGTIAIVTDFYELLTIGGQKAGRFCADELSRTPLKLLFSPFFAAYLGLGPWGNPGRYSAQDLMDSLDWPEIVATREWQAGVTFIPDPAVQDFLASTYQRGLVMEGHLEGRSGNVLQAGAAMGTRSDHEVANGEEAMERARLGMVVQARQSTCMWDLENVVQALVDNKDIDTRNFAFSTDEMEADEIFRDGHVDNRIRLAAKTGVDPLVSVQMATLNPAQFYRVDHEFGSLTPGRIATIVFLEDLKNFKVGKVVADGKLVAENGAYFGESSRSEYPKSAYETMNVKGPITPASFHMAAPNGKSKAKINVIGIREGSILTDALVHEAPVNDGQVKADPARDLAKFAVIDRHEASGRIGLGFIHRLGLKAGAIGSSFNPGLCNIAVIGINDDDMAVVANRIAELGGGYVAAKEGKVIAELAMPLWGVFSERPFEEVVKQLQRVNDAFHNDLGSDFQGFHIGAGFCCLTIIIPSLKLCDLGYVMVNRDGAEAAPLFVED